MFVLHRSLTFPSIPVLAHLSQASFQGSSVPANTHTHLQALQTDSAGPEPSVNHTRSSLLPAHLSPLVSVPLSFLTP